MINKTKPYIIYLIENISELERIQIKLFSDGYKWINGANVDLSFNIILPNPFPIYISNLQYILKEDILDNLKKRYNFNEYNNNILFISPIKEDFDLILLRKDKLLELKKYENK